MTAFFRLVGAELKQLREKAKKLSKTMVMNSCRLQFQAFLADANGKFTQVLESVRSDEIIDGSEYIVLYISVFIVWILPYMEVRSPYIEIYGIVFGSRSGCGVTFLKSGLFLFGLFCSHDKIR